MELSISIITPTLNERENIRRLAAHLKPVMEGSANATIEHIVVDAGSTDGTAELAAELGLTVIHCEQQSRAVQMNRGAAAAKGYILWFVHADVLPPLSFPQDIHKSLQKGYAIGGYRFRFDSRRPLLGMLSWFTRFDWEFCRGGDQTIFITRTLFEDLGGYNEGWDIMEEYELMRRARQTVAFRIIPKDVLVSARKYQENSFLRVQRANFVVFRMYRKGASPAAIKAAYHRLLKHPKDHGL